MNAADKTHVNEMQARKLCSQEVFSYAELLVDVIAQEHGVTNTETKVIPVGSTVLVTMISRFGHVGIRHRNQDEIRHGYDACVSPNQLHNYRWAQTQSSNAIKYVAQKLNT